MREARINQAHIEAIAVELGERDQAAGNVEALAERKDLEPACVTALRPFFDGHMEKSRKVEIPYWENVGQVDLVSQMGELPDQFAWLAELKWCRSGPDILYEAVWDLFKMALGSWRGEKPRCYLITGAAASRWDSPFADLFDDREHDPVELCMRELGGRNHRLAWDALLKGGYDHQPTSIPARLRTVIRGRARVGAWELQAVEVEVVDLISMDGGWPYGRRPSQARRPA